eukprot:TRINITY_DN6399_c0_g1_i2.p1 TRINITY_DN6399_c0_g1~~TRINITY_DN6399_c0_g1_i2.p1  ORF type:complete len:531 (+),score=104.83 TRINITY_DN6399_c0_g1_i2:286-1878(+)
MTTPVSGKLPADQVLSATGKLVPKGSSAFSNLKERVPEIKSEEIEVLQEISGGCFGTVYRGKCRGQTVAVKKLLKQDLDERTLEEFRKEVDIMTQMRHPKVVLFMGACTEPGKLMMVSELLQGSLYDLLRKNKDISLVQRIKFCKDTAAGMAWLHGARPQIIHRDLKPQNLLIDEHWNIKVCDFGLSAIKPRNVKIRDGKNIPGTPLWMAPEVLLGKEVDDKADVYSFGIVMWEIITGKEPFPHHDNFEKFHEAITKHNERPPIPQDLHPSLKSTMEACWHNDKNKRPAFVDLLPILDAVLVDITIDDTEGNKFWKASFLGKDKVAWSEFSKAFYKLLKVELNLKDINYLCIKKVLVEPNSDTVIAEAEAVTVERFALVLNCFGPLRLDYKGFSFLDKIRVLMQREWFHGDIDQSEAENLLSGQAEGTFLVRISQTLRQYPFAISKVNKKSKINHQRIMRKPDGTFELQITFSSGKTKVETSKDDLLAPLIRNIAKDLFLNTPCPGSRYRGLFIAAKTEGYLGDETIDDE